MWRKMFVAEFKVLCRHLPSRTEENHKIPLLASLNWCPGRDLKPESAE